MPWSAGAVHSTVSPVRVTSVTATSAGVSGGASSTASASMSAAWAVRAISVPSRWSVNVVPASSAHVTCSGYPEASGAAGATGDVRSGVSAVAVAAIDALPAAS